jgi:endo-1,4-beta-xylanase
MRWITRIAVASLIATGLLTADDVLRFPQPEIPLWTDAELGPVASDSTKKWNPSTDGFHRITNIHKPSMFVFLPPKERATGAAVVICPGGGRQYLVMDLEGSLVAEKLNAMGVAAFVLKSRLSRAPGSTYKTEFESLQDAQRAIAIVRSRANEWSVDPTRVGIMGFSAGGELAALAETRYDTLRHVPTSPCSCTLPYATEPFPSPRTHLRHSSWAPAMIPISAQAAEYYSKLRAAGVPAELHIYTKGGHGFGMTGRNAQFRHLPVSSWPDRLREWLFDQGLLSKKAKP